MSEPPEIVELKAAQREEAVTVLTEAFLQSPPYTALIPKEEKRRALLLWLHKKMVEYCALYGEVITDRSLKGVACWLPPGNTNLTPWRIIRSGFYTMPLHVEWETCRRLLSEATIANKLRVENAPKLHSYLWVLGVSPDSQGRGIGRELVRAMLEKANSQCAACYLETEEEENVSFYESLGFRVAARDVVPNFDIHIWAMVRESGGAQ